MAIRSDTYYTRLAEDWLQKLGVQEPPVPLERVAAHLAVPMRNVHLPSFFTAAIINEDGLPAIMLNLDVPQSRARDALAHVLAHVMVVMDDPEASYPRTESEHHVADLMGSVLVMPDYLVVDQARKWFNDHRYLARLFGVTEQQMLHRMTDLGLVKPRGIQWEY